MKTLLRNKDYILLDGEIHIFATPSRDNIDKPYIQTDSGTKPVSHSTASLQGVKQLDRSLFMKGVDVSKLAWEYSTFDQAASCFIDGYNANKNEFSYDEAKELFNEGFRQGTGEYPSTMFYECVNNLRPLSLPSSITINGDEITINWL